jgi:hypothetical protein
MLAGASFLVSSAALDVIAPCRIVRVVEEEHKWGGVRIFAGLHACI